MGDRTIGPSSAEIEGSNQNKSRLEALVVLSKGWDYKKTEQEKDPLSDLITPKLI